MRGILFTGLLSVIVDRGSVVFDYSVVAGVSGSLGLFVSVSG